jgi:HSP20 family protein
MVMRFDPFREMDRVAQMMTQQTGSSRAFSVPIDAYRSDDHFTVRLDLPGVDPSSIDITVEKNVVTVRAERSWSPGDNEDVIVQERPQGIFVRQLFLGEGLDADAVQATYENGVLTLAIPVAEQAKPRKVPVTAGGQSNRQIEAQTSSSPA